MQHRKKNITLEQLEQTQQIVKQAIACLIDAYAEGMINKEVFEPRSRSSKAQLKKLETESQAAAQR